jgi:hypothetical protein
LKKLIIVAVAILLAVGAFFGYRFYNQFQERAEAEKAKTGIAGITENRVDIEPIGSDEETAVATDSGDDPTGNNDSEATAAPPVESLTESDAYLRGSYSGSDAYVDKLLQRKNIIRDAVTGIDLIRRDKNPGRKWFFLQPEGELIVEERDGGTYLSSENYRRYQPMADAIEKADTSLVVGAYRLMLPLVRDAYAELGNDDMGWEDALKKALDELIAVRIPEGDIELVGKEGVYIYADDALENLTPASKALIRMGPENAARVQTKLKEMRRALFAE